MVTSATGLLSSAYALRMYEGISQLIPPRIELAEADGRTGVRLSALPRRRSATSKDAAHKGSEHMNNAVTIGLVLAILVLGALVAWLYFQRRRTDHLQDRFGPEYDQAVRSEGDQRKAEAALAARTKRVERLQIRPLSARERDQFGERWHAAQARFVDDPGVATHEADDLVGEVMRVRGYPVGDFQQRTEDVSVDHPNVVEHYRSAHAIALRNDEQHANTEELRTAFVHYRALFDDLLEIEEPARQEQPIPTEARR